MKRKATNQFDSGLRGIALLDADLLGQTVSLTKTECSIASRLYSKVLLLPHEQTLQVGACVYYREEEEEDNSNDRVFNDIAHVKRACRLGLVSQIKLPSQGAKRSAEEADFEACELVLHRLVRAGETDLQFMPIPYDSTPTTVYLDEAVTHTVRIKHGFMALGKVQFDISAHSNGVAAKRQPVDAICSLLLNKDNQLHPLDTGKRLAGLFQLAAAASGLEESAASISTTTTAAAAAKRAGNKSTKSATTTTTASKRLRSEAGVPLHPEIARFDILLPSTWTRETVEWNL